MQIRTMTVTLNSLEMKKESKSHDQIKVEKYTEKMRVPRKTKRETTAHITDL